MHAPGLLPFVFLLALSGDETTSLLQELVLVFLIERVPSKTQWFCSCAVLQKRSSFKVNTREDFLLINNQVTVFQSFISTQYHTALLEECLLKSLACVLAGLFFFFFFFLYLSYRYFFLSYFQG